MSLPDISFENIGLVDENRYRGGISLVAVLVGAASRQQRAKLAHDPYFSSACEKGYIVARRYTPKEAADGGTGMEKNSSSEDA